MSDGCFVNFGIMGFSDFVIFQANRKIKQFQNQQS
jgi:hypothetical protein